MTAAGKSVKEGEWITLDGGEGVVYSGQMDLVTPQFPPAYETLMKCGRQHAPSWNPGRTPTPRRMLAKPVSSAPKASACAAPNTCSSTDFEHPEKGPERQRAIPER